ncbi:hypothetical protein BDA96_03G216000 [Sorghum bicolor]|uniref:Uncharacterized protein n=2 Tax=Sorghum bicolor TaxID=4558 RepID=A0A1W0VY78_SORBI|nr:hypothetical protein BDA96_03G216000 [Sorghum bicolor]OQU87065.1 hypothetical protein SORBI_3003G199600 [Sorghum bicolor]
MWVCTVPPSSALAALAFALFLLNSGVAMHRALGRGDAWVAAFVAAATVLVAALLATVRAHEERRRRRGLLKAAAWAQSAALTAIFAHRVAAALAPAMACLVWTMAGSTVAGGFYCLFLHGRDDDGVVAGGRDARRA